ncbi:TPA: hypothetical protein HA281_06550 [Candidatus Woesearchaeota archaeon]|nr:hypothetical protein [Candidatus Woesearchaeota archaeon]HII64057.1 hypothetical protein [Candidatus Woesearchaeota archaeon]
MSLGEKVAVCFSVEGISEIYPGSVPITDLSEIFGTPGHILAIRGDEACADELGELRHWASPKMWLYQKQIEEVREHLRLFQKHKLFDGVGFSGLEAVAFHAHRIGREAVVVMPREIVVDSDFFKRYSVEVIYADAPAEQGYVEKQKEILHQRGSELVLLDQAKWGAHATAPIGNNVVRQLEEKGIIPHFTFWCIASGSNLYGIGAKIKQRFPSAETVVVEPERYRTIDPGLDLSSPSKVRAFAEEKIDSYILVGWDKREPKKYAPPLHFSHPNLYLLHLWKHTGNLGFDETVGVPMDEALRVQQYLKEKNPAFHWTETTALALVPAIEKAGEGMNVMVMVYGKHRERQMNYKD